MIKTNYLLLGLITIFSCHSGENTKSKEDPKTDKVQLRFQPIKDESYQMVYTFTVKNEKTGDEPTFDIDVVCTVRENTHSKIILETEYKEIAMHGKLKGTSINLRAGDSLSTTLPEANLVAAPVFTFLHRKVESHYDSQFRKTKEIIDGNDSLQSLDGNESKVQFIARYPEKAIGINDTWSDELEIKIGNKKIEKAVFKVSSMNEKEIQLEISGNIDGESEKFGKPFQVQGSFKGTATVDIKTGWQNQAKLNLTFTLTIDGNTIPMVQVIEFKLK